MQPFVDPARKLRSALATCSPTHPSLDYFIRLAFRLPTEDENGHRDYRNTDPQTRQTSLHLAALKGRTDFFEWLLEEGVDEAEVSRDVFGDTVLHIAAAKGHADIAELYLSRYPFVIEWVNSRGMSPLHVAAKEGQLELAQMLLDAGADIDAPDLEGNTPLHYASAWGKVPVLRLLVDSDCQTDWRNNEGFTPAEFAFSFGVLKELEASIKQHMEDIRDARRQAREDRRSKRAASTLQAKRVGPESSLSISVPSPDPGVDPVAYNVGLGLSQQTSTESADPYYHGGVPRLGPAVPPTPRTGAAQYPREGYRDPRPPLRETADSPPGTPRSARFMYPNTTSPQPSPSASLASSNVPIVVPVVASATGYADARMPLRTVSTHSSLANLAAPAPISGPAPLAPATAPATAPETITYRPPSRKHSSSFGAASAALVQDRRQRETSAPPQHSLAPPVLVPVPGLSPMSPEAGTGTEIPSDWPPNATVAPAPVPAPPPPSSPPQPHPPTAHNKLVKKSRAGGHPLPPAAITSSPPRTGPPPRASTPGLPIHPVWDGSPVLVQGGRADDRASAYDLDIARAEPSLLTPAEQIAYRPPVPGPPAASLSLAPGRSTTQAGGGGAGTGGSGPQMRSFSGPAATAVPASHFAAPRASFETDASARTSMTGNSSVSFGPTPVSRRPGPGPGPGIVHDPRRVVSHAQFQPPLAPPHARSALSLPHAAGPTTTPSRGREQPHHKLVKKHRPASGTHHDQLVRTTSVSTTGNGSDRAEKSGGGGGGRLARALGFGKKS
ncbi:hypothetical protein JCM3774_003221 [Rhodotorula dairenensis]